MSQESDAILRELALDPGVARRLKEYFECLEVDEEASFRSLAEAAVFNDSRINDARAQWGRWQMARDASRRLSVLINSQYTR